MLCFQANMEAKLLKSSHCSFRRLYSTKCMDWRVAVPLQVSACFLAWQQHFGPRRNRGLNLFSRFVFKLYCNIECPVFHLFLAPWVWAATLLLRTAAKRELSHWHHLDLLLLVHQGKSILLSHLVVRSRGSWPAFSYEQSSDDNHKASAKLSAEGRVQTGIKCTVAVSQDQAPKTPSARTGPRQIRAGPQSMWSNRLWTRAKPPPSSAQLCEGLVGLLACWRGDYLSSSSERW